MSIRLRVVDGYLVALCAARSVPKEGDTYLDDAAHTALARKFWLDYPQVGIECEAKVKAITEREESNNENRTWWDAQYAAAPAPTEEEIARVLNYAAEQMGWGPHVKPFSTVAALKDFMDERWKLWAEEVLAERVTDSPEILRRFNQILGYFKPGKEASQARRLLTDYTALVSGGAPPAAPAEPPPAHAYEPRDCGGACIICGCGKNAHAYR